MAKFVVISEKSAVLGLVINLLGLGFQRQIEAQAEAERLEAETKEKFKMVWALRKFMLESIEYRSDEDKSSHFNKCMGLSDDIEKNKEILWNGE